MISILARADHGLIEHERLIVTGEQDAAVIG